MLGAKLRKNGREDSTWNPTEEKEWDIVCDEIDIWWHVLTEEDKKVLEPVEEVLGLITRSDL